MRQYMLKRLLWILPTLLVITFVSYGMMRLAPGDPVQAQFIGSGIEEAAVIEEGKGESDSAKIFRKAFYLDRPIHIGYVLWLKGILLEGDFGQSVTINLGTPVLELLRDRVPVTLKLNLWALAISFLLAIPIGVHSAVRRGSLLDRSSTVTLFVLYSLPSFWVGLLLLMAASSWLPAWPTRGLSPPSRLDASLWGLWLETAKHYVLPVFCLTYAGLASLSRYARVGLLEVLRQDYIRTARAKGCSEWTVIFRHALRNGVIPLIVIFAGLLPGLIGGSVIIEYLFGIEGMGSLGIAAISSRDYPVIMTILAVSSILTLMGILLSDLSLALVDPRISYDRRV
jgi:peptide/nickel transport system permease protein